jgi:hypothetical protein
MGFRRKPAGVVTGPLGEGSLNLLADCQRAASVAGGDFKFDFTLGASTLTTASMTSLSAATTTAATTAATTGSTTATSTTTAPPIPSGTFAATGGTSTLQGFVWAHDGRGASLARDAQEVGLSGQTIEVRSGTGALVASVLTGLDVNGNGQISSDEAGIFKVTNLPAGNYTVTQVPTASWVQGYSSGYTGDQMLVDGPHKDLRRARASGMSLIPTTTGSATAIGMIFPELQGRLNGLAVRVPLANASLTDCVFEVERPTSVDEVNQMLGDAAGGPLAGILGYEERPLVSIDYRDDPRSSIVDAPSTMVIDGTQVKVLAWYDNEWGYANRYAELARTVAANLPGA